MPQYLEDGGGETRYYGEAQAFHHVKLKGTEFVLAEVAWYEGVKKHNDTGLDIAKAPVTFDRRDAFVSVTSLQGKFFYGEFSSKQYLANKAAQRVRVLLPWRHLHQAPPKADYDDGEKDDEQEEDELLFHDDDDDDDIQ